MHLFGESGICSTDGCGHPKSEHVNDHVLHEGILMDVHRCIVCERDGGVCTDAAKILPE